MRQGNGGYVFGPCCGERVEGGLEGRARGEDVIEDYI